MLATKRKIIRSRKQLLTRIYILAGLIILGCVVGFLLAQKLFVKNSYLSPLSKLQEKNLSQADTENIDLLTDGLKQQKIDVASVKQQDVSYVVTLKDGATIIFSAQKNINSQISSLQVILSRLTMEGRLFRQLDLRFDKPVILLK